MTTIPRSQVAGLVLVGGESARMGQDKAGLIFAGEPLWKIARSLLHPLTDRVIFIDSGSRAASEMAPVIHDNPPGHGPLGGIATGLEQSGYTHHLLLAVDYPLVQRPLLELLIERAGESWAVCGRSATFVEPLVAYYNAACAPVIRAMITEGEIRTHKLYERVPSIILNDASYDAVDPRRLSQFNVNTPEDLKRAQTIHDAMDAATSGG